VHGERLKAVPRPWLDTLINNAPPSVSVNANVAPPGPTPTPVTTKTPEELKLQLLRVKLHPSVLSLVYRLKNKEEPANLAWVSGDRKAEVQVWLTKKSDAAKAKLKELGFETLLDQSGTTLMVGRIPLDKLEALAELDFVRYMSPQISR